MNKLPYFQFFAKDWLSIRELTYEQKGAYVDLLAIAWEDHGIPNDPERIRRMLQLSPRRFAVVWPAIEGKWEENGNGRLVNPRQERQRDEIEAFRRKARRAANARWGKEKKRNANA